MQRAKATKQDIYDHIEKLIRSAEEMTDGDGFAQIWDSFWEGVRALRERGLDPDYCDPDTTHRADIMACWEAYRELLQGKSGDLQELIEKAPWKDD